MWVDRLASGGGGQNGGSALDVSIRPGAVGFSTAKVATVETVRREGRGKQPSSSFFCHFPLPPGRYEWDFFFGAGGRGSETPKRPLFEPLLGSCTFRFLFLNTREIDPFSFSRRVSFFFFFYKRLRRFNRCSRANFFGENQR